MPARDEPPASRHRIEVRHEESGTRLDRLVADRLASLGISRSAVRRLLDEGRIRIRGEDDPPKASRGVEPGTVIEIEVPAPPPLEAEPEPIPIEVVYEDDHLIVVEKPAGMVVHPARGRESGTLVNALLHHTALSSIGRPRRPGIVHRLDMGTTGLVVAAKTDAAHLALKRAFKQRSIEKEYMALCYGRIDPPGGRIEAPIGRSPRDRTKMTVFGEGMKEALTDYRSIETLPGPCTLLRLRLHTGRTHQIRVHLASIGHPIVGDAKYAGDRWKGLPSRRLRDAFRGLDRPFLHAARLAFQHPITGEDLELTSDLPADLQGLLEALRADRS